MQEQPPCLQPGYRRILHTAQNATRQWSNDPNHKGATRRRFRPTGHTSGRTSGRGTGGTHTAGQLHADRQPASAAYNSILAHFCPFCKGFLHFYILDIFKQPVLIKLDTLRRFYPLSTLTLPALYFYSTRALPTLYRYSTVEKGGFCLPNAFRKASETVFPSPNSGYIAFQKQAHHRSPTGQSDTANIPMQYCKLSFSFLHRKSHGNAKYAFAMAFEPMLPDITFQYSS